MIAAFLVSVSASVFNPYTDPILSNIFTQQTDCETKTDEAPESSDGEHYSWDNLYLKPSAPEVIIDPYAKPYPESGYFY